MPESLTTTLAFLRFPLTEVLTSLQRCRVYARASAILQAVGMCAAAGGFLILSRDALVDVIERDHGDHYDHQRAKEAQASLRISHRIHPAV